VVVVAGHQRQHFLAGWQRQRIEKFRPAKRARQHHGFLAARVVVHHIVRAQEHIDLVRRAIHTTANCTEFGMNQAVGFATPRNQHAFADEISHKAVKRAMVELVRRVPLHNPPALHHRHPVSHGKGFVLIVGHQQSGRARSFQNGAHFLRKFFAQFGIEIRKRLVHQQQLRLGRQRTRQGHALLLTARELMRIAFPFAT